jgi:CRISPR-associated endonuclease Csn1
MKNTASLPLDSEISIGLDIGIGSAAIAVLKPGSLEHLYVHCFPVPEDAKTKELLNAQRRQHRLARRQTHRRRRRRNDVARLLVKHLGLRLEDIKGRDQVDPWSVRARGLGEELSALEFAAALMHIVKRRGFQSNSKELASGNDAEGGKALRGIASMTEKSQRYATVGEMMFGDAEFADKKRNKPNDYSHTVSRQSMREEAEALFAAQRRHNSSRITANLEEEFLAAAFFQRPLQASEHLLGTCPFEPAQKRSSSFAPGFERFRYLAKLNSLRLREPESEPRAFSDAELAAAAALFGTRQSITYKHVRKAAGLSDGTVFEGIPRDKPLKGALWEGADICRSAGSCVGTMALKKAIADHTGKSEWARILDDSELLDDIAFTITFREQIRSEPRAFGPGGGGPLVSRPGGDGQDNEESIERGLRERGIPDDLIEPLLVATEAGVFKKFKGAGQISALAARRINGGLAKGLVYSAACEQAGYDHAAQAETKISDIANPVVRTVLRESKRLLKTVLHDLGARPGRITIEMARDVGKPVDVRGKIAKANNERHGERLKFRQQYADDVGKDPTSEELLAYQLWKEQNHCCVYSGQVIHPRDLDLSRRAVEIDHVLPRSRSQDNSYHNKVLCLTELNQAKKNRSPFEWMQQEPHAKSLPWEEFEVWVQSLPAYRGMKKRGLLMRNFADREQGFVSRNLNDTRYACKVLRAELETLYRGESVEAKTGSRKRRVFTRPGSMTAVVRRSWGLENLKKDADGSRTGDLHHAVDAAVVAALGADEGLTQQLTNIYQHLEGTGRAYNIDGIKLPWPTFRDEVRDRLDKVFVTRLERRKKVGEGHEATIRRLRKQRDDDGVEQRVVFERKDIAKVTAPDLEKLDPVRQRNLIVAVGSWLDQDKKTRPVYPCMPSTGDANGPEIRKIRLPIGKASGIELQGGLVKNGSMIRTDVFRDDEGFWLVPVYAHQIADHVRYLRPPHMASIAYKPPEEWHDVSDATFLFSLYPWSFVRLTSRKGEFFEGYYRGMNISVASLSLSGHANSGRTESRGVKSLAVLEKRTVSLLGGHRPSEMEVRQWPGAVSI